MDRRTGSSPTSSSSPERLGRRSFALASLGLLVAACGDKKPAVAPTGPAPAPLKLEPLVDTVPSAGLTWLVWAKPRALAQEAELVPPIALLFPEDRFAAFAKRHGGLDLRQMHEVVVAKYGDATSLYAARIPHDPAKLEAAFAGRATVLEARAVDQLSPPVVRMFGEVAGERQQIAIFGRDAVALEVGRFGPLRAVEAFAMGKLKKAKPALRAGPLARVAELAGDAPVIAAAPGPFTGELERGLGGLLRAATSVGLAVSPRGKALVARVVVTGAFADDAPRAAERLAAAVHVVRESGLGRLCGAHEPLREPVTRSTPDALVHEVELDAARIAKGLHDAVDADVAEIMRMK